MALAIEALHDHELGGFGTLADLASTLRCKRLTLDWFYQRHLDSTGSGFVPALLRMGELVQIQFRTNRLPEIACEIAAWQALRDKLDIHIAGELFLRLQQGQGHVDSCHGHVVALRANGHPVVCMCSTCR